MVLQTIWSKEQIHKQAHRFVACLFPSRMVQQGTVYETARKRLKVKEGSRLWYSQKNVFSPRFGIIGSLKLIFPTIPESQYWYSIGI